MTCNGIRAGTNHLRKYCSNACRQKAYRRSKAPGIVQFFAEMQLERLEAQVQKLREELGK